MVPDWEEKEALNPDWDKRPELKSVEEIQSIPLFATDCDMQSEAAKALQAIIDETSPVERATWFKNSGSETYLLGPESNQGVFFCGKNPTEF